MWYTYHTMRRLWNGKYQKILKLTMEGLTQKEIGEEIGTDNTTICEIQHRPEFMKRRLMLEKAATDQVKDELSNYAMTAAKKIKQIARSGKPDQRVQLDAAKEILYMVGCKPKEVVETISRTYTLEEVTSARNTFAEVEEMMGRLGTTKSKFIVTQKSEESSKPSGEDVGAIETGDTGQETVPEKPVLSV
jgi:2-oxoglutarate dehydrogenase complex dehydrogenase (E1) component-like enzyme